MTPITMSSSKPYLLRALYDWIVDNEMTPYVVIDANYNSVQVPQDFVDDGRIILNISPVACRGLHIENDRIVFTARFSGIAQQIFAPPAAIMAIYAKETGRGMVFTHDGTSEETEGGNGDTPTPPAAASSSKSGPSRKPALKVVK